MTDTLKYEGTGTSLNDPTQEQHRFSATPEVKQRLIERMGKPIGSINESGTITMLTQGSIAGEGVVFITRKDQPDTIPELFKILDEHNLLSRTDLSRVPQSEAVIKRVMGNPDNGSGISF